MLQALPLELDGRIQLQFKSIARRRTSLGDRSPVPTAFILSSLFRVRRRKGQRGAGDSTKRRALVRSRLLTTNSVNIEYTGAELDQDDLVVYTAVAGLIADVSEARGCTELELSPYRLLTRLGWGTGSKEYAALRSTLDRLKHTCIKIDSRSISDGVPIRCAYEGSLLPALHVRATSRSVVLGFSAELVRLYAHGMVGLDRQVLRDLRSQLARWAYVFFAAAPNDHAWSLPELRLMSGSSASTSRFRYLLEQALTEVQIAGVDLSFVFQEQPDAPPSILVKQN